MYLLDANILIEFSRNHLPHVYDFMSSSNHSLFKVPAIVKAELMVGAMKSKDPVSEEFKVQSLLLPFDIVPFDDTCTQAYGRIRADLERKGLGIGPNDYMIAATALAHSAVLVTHNVREFERVPGLIIEDWTETRF